MRRRFLALILLALPATTRADDAPSGVYRAEPVAASPKMAASGMAWWKDRLIVADRGGRRLVAFTPPDRFETFAADLTPVGVAVDPAGNLVVVDKDEGGRLLRFAPDGKRIGQILLPEICSNVCFGGTRRNRLFMTGSQSLYAVYVETQGAHIS